MSSIFERASTRIFCIAGVLGDIYAMPDLRLLTFEEYLNERLHRMGYEQIIFFSGAKQLFFALDAAGCDGIAALNRKAEPAPAQPAPPAAAEPAAQHPRNLPFGTRSPAARQQQQTERRGLSYTHEFSARDGAETRAMEQMDRLMHDASHRRVLVFVSLEDFLRNTEQNAHRRASAYFEDWRSLPTENENICIFLSKSIDMSNLQELFRSSGALSLQSLFFRQGSGGAAEYNHNSSMIVGPPLNDEVGNLMQYLRIVGHTYTRRNAQQEDVTLTARLSWADSDFVTLTRALSFYSRSSEFTELKGIKETLEQFMEDRGTDTVVITPEDIAPLYPLSTQHFADRQDPLAFLRSRRGWEPAYAVLNTFVMNTRSMYPADAADSPQTGEQPVPDIERMEPGRAQQNSRIRVPNFVLQGNPGVGKTEIAGLIGQILQQEGILKSGHTVTASRDRLIGQYVGWTAVQTAALIEQAQEGVLLVDEVYSLAEGGDNNTASFCKEAFDTLVAAMTNKNNRFCVIFAGYENRMHEVWDMNEGLFSRFGEANVITIPEYQPDLLQSIFTGCVTKADGDAGWRFVLSEDVASALPEFFKNLFSDRDKKSFGNARDMNSLAATVRRAACYRHIVMLQEQHLPAAEHRTVTVERSDFGDKEKLFEKRGFSTDDIYAQIYEYVGLEFLVDLFNDQLAIKVESEEKGLPYPGPAHMLWLGNPGTGKSTAAQLTASLYHTLGMLGSDKPIYVDASELTSAYIAESARIINTKMDEACNRHAILVIDEAYQLIRNNNGREVINAMLNRMETDRKNFNVIFIVYTDERENFLRANPGLASRLQVYEFKDYTADQLVEIFKIMCRKMQDTYEPDALSAVSALLHRLYDSQLTRDGNARIVRQLLEEMRQRRYQRVISGLAAALPGGDTPKNRSRIAADRALGKLRVDSGAYVFTADDLPPDFLERRRNKGIAAH